MKLHRMPLLVKRMIIEELGFVERLFLSFTSKRTCSLLRLFRNDFKVSIEMNIRTWEVSIRVRKLLYSLTEGISAINISSSISNELKFDIPYKQSYLIGFSSWTTNTIYCGLIDKRAGRDTMSNSMIVFGKVLRHLNSVLNIEECRQCVFFTTLHVGLFCQLDRDYSYGSIETRTECIADATPEDLTFLLDNIKAKRLSLNVTVPSPPAYKYRNNPEKKSSLDVLKIVHHSWVDFSDLPAAKAVSIEKKIQMDQMNTMLQSWVAGRNRALEIGDFEIHRLMDMNREAIFNGLTRHETQLTEAEIESFFDFSQLSPNRKFLRCIVVVDIVRKCDGMRATVIEGRNISEPIRYMFVMVWSESNLRTIGRGNN